MIYIPNLISIDLGYYQTKSYFRNKTFLLRSKVEQIQNSTKFSSGIKFTLNDKTYLVGNGAEHSSLDLQKYNNETYKLITYAVLCNIGPGSYNLITSLPLNYCTKQYKTVFRNYLETNSTTILFNHKPLQISIPSVLIVPQTASIIYTNPLLYKNEIIGIIDVGGLTASGCIFDNLDIIKSSIFTEQHGSLYLFQQIKSQLNQQFTLNLQEYEIKYIIQNGLKNHEEQSVNIINSIFDDYVKNIKKQTILYNWEINSIPILFSGGTSLLLKDHITKHFPTATISSNALYDNCIGAYNMAEIFYRAK